MKLLATIFSLFCFYFLPCLEAKAETVIVGTHSACADQVGYQLEDLSPLHSDDHHLNPDRKNWLPEYRVITEVFQAVLLVSYCMADVTFFPALGSKDFYIRTGLSPPQCLI